MILAHEQRMAPATVDQIQDSLDVLLALIGGPMTMEDRTEWSMAMLVELQTLPADLVLDGLVKARRQCTRASEVLKCVIGYIDDTAFRRRRRLERMYLLANKLGLQRP